MSTTTHAVEHGESHAGHPTARFYVMVGIVLAIITAVEVWMYYVEKMFGDWLVPLLLILSAVKFVIVVGAFMHLKFDHPIFTYMFGFGLFIASAVIISLLFLFNGHIGPPPIHAAPAGSHGAVDTHGAPAAPAAKPAAGH
jgi:heme/copper-type cytochrome/quinol oxidase subunit 4